MLKLYGISTCWILLAILTFSCNPSGQNNLNAPVDSLSATDSLLSREPDTRKQLDSERPPIINITDTVSTKCLLIAMKDSASDYERIGGKLGEIFMARIGGLIKKNRLSITGAPIVWYKTRKAPFFFEAGIPVNKKPGKMPKHAFLKNIGRDSVVIAHFYGPYALLPQAYEAAASYIASQKKKANGTPYEIYVDDPMGADGKPNDPYKVRTDVVFPIK